MHKVLLIGLGSILLDNITGIGVYKLYVLLYNGVMKLLA